MTLQIQMHTRNAGGAEIRPAGHCAREGTAGAHDDAAPARRDRRFAGAGGGA